MFNETDIDFLKGMIPHHEMAIEMAKKEIADGSSEQVKSLAQSIQNAQASEIELMKGWLADEKQSNKKGQRMMNTRSYSAAQVRVAPDGKRFVGLAIPFNSLSRDLGGFVERFMPGSVTDSIRSGEVVALLNHNLSQTLGTQRAGTLRMTEDAEGVHVEIDAPDTTYANDARALMARGDGTGMSFGFSPVDVQWKKENGMNVAEVHRAELGEVSVLTGPPPAYRATSIALRSGPGQSEDYGIDIDKLSAVFISIKKGLPLSADETQIIKQARSLFAHVRRPLMEQAEQRAMKTLLD